MNDVTMKILSCILALVIAATGCSADGSEDNGLVDLVDDQSLDASSDSDEDTGDLQDTREEVEPSDVPDSGDGDTGNAELSDVSADVDDAGDSGDADSDDPDITDITDSDLSDPFVGRPTGQCIDSGDCPSGFCSDAPGGVCVGCGSTADCPGGAECRVGTCIFTCQSETDCPPGFECLGSGRCGIIACQQGVCPVSLYACGETNPSRCARASCNNGEQCPENTTCTNGVCVADRALP